MGGTLPSRQVAGRRRYHLLRLEVAGRVLLIADGAVVVTTDAGAEMHFAGGLSRVEHREERVGGQVDAEPTTLAMDLWTPEIDWSALRARGHDLQGWGEVSEWAPGLTWEQRRRIVYGRISEPTYGRRGERLSLALAMDPGSDLTIIPDRTAVIDASTWPSAHEDAVGESYPLPFGAPGEYVSADGVITLQPGTRCYLVDATVGSEKALLAGGRVGATSVTLWDDTGASEVLTVSHEQDARGRTVAVVDLSSALTIDPTQASYWAALSRASGGGLIGRHARAMFGAGEIVRWLLRMSSLPVHLGQVDAVESVLDRYQLSGAIGSETSPSEYVRSQIIPLLPCSLTQGPQGLEVQLVRPGRPVARLSTATGLVRLSRPELDRPASEVTSEVRVRYAVNAELGEASRELVMTPLCFSGDTAVARVYLAQESYRQVGRRARATDRRTPPSVDPIETTVVGDRATAGRIARDRLRAEGFAPELVSYWDMHRLWDHVRTGHTVLVDDEAIGLDGARAYVQAVEEAEHRRSFLLRLEAPRRRAA